MSQKRVAILIFCVFLLVGSVLVGAVFLTESKYRKKQERCTMKTYGIVSKAAPYRSRDIDHYPHETWYCFYQYEAGGRQYEKRGAFGRSRPLFEVGQKVALFYNPQDGEDFYVPQEWQFRLGLLLKIIGSVFLAIAVLTAAIAVKML